MSAIIVPEHFIRATRDTGYRNLATALSELIDNSVDAGASEVDIRVSEEGVGEDRRVMIGVMDDGAGMDRDTLWNCLRFGGSERFNSRRTLGRYGMGLPNSSVSQAPRVDVFTWRRGAGPLQVHLDVEEIADRRRDGLAPPSPTDLPTWVHRRPPSGTLVLWSRCDRLRFKKADTVVRKLRPVLGRIYRLLLSNGLRLRLNGDPVRPIDPLFRTPSEDLPGTAEPYGEPLQYRIKAPAGGSSLVTVLFVELPVRAWHELPPETKRRAGIVGGAGMSVLRGGREIDYGWLLFGKKRRENYDDWWRCELQFGPVLDEMAGITHSKQGVNPGPELRAILEPDLERIARELNARVRRAFRGVRPDSTGAAVKRANGRDRLLPAPREGQALPKRRLATGYSFKIALESAPRQPEFFSTEMRGSELVLRINQQHPFYQRLYVSDAARSSDLDLLLLAVARALYEFPEESRARFVRSWSDNLLAYLDR